MNVNFRKTALLVCIFSVFSLGNTMHLFATSSDTAEAVQQSRQITGTVTDAMGPITGANIMERGTSNGTITDINGRFSLNVSPGATLTVSFIGYQTQEIAVGNNTVFNITLLEDTETLDEVVVVGYGVQRKRLVTGATVEVRGEDVARRNTISALSALQNQSPGVNIVSASGQPGDGYRVNIRGAGTNGNTNPVYVIDGVVGDINGLNPGDIERIDVLKDAASAAIYGARAANGVILITTKQGRVGKVMVAYDGNIGWQNVPKLPDLLDAKQYMEIMDLTNFNVGLQPFEWEQYLDADLLAAYRNGSNPGTNWIEQLRNDNAITTSHTLNITGGSELSKFSTGVGYQYQDGIFGGPVTSDYRRFTLRLNSEHIIYKNGNLDVLKFGQNLYYQHTQNQGIRLGNQYYNSIYNMLGANPLVPVFNSKGEYFAFDDLKAQGTHPNGLLGLHPYIGNPLNSLVHGGGGNNRSRNHNLTATAYVEFQPILNLIYRGLGYYKQYSGTWKEYNGIYTNNGSDNNSNDSLNQNMTTGWNWGTTHTLNYAFDAENHHFDILAGTEYSREGNGMAETISGQANNSIFGDFKHAYFNNFAGRTSGTVGGSPANDHSIMSYFGRLNYNYGETYMFSAIFRADGSSNFAKGKRWGYFPSFSAGWLISNASFMDGTSDVIDFLKIRASWGQNGNEGIGAFKYSATYNFGDRGLYSFGNNKDGATQGGYPSRLSNPDLTWETSEQINIGLDLRFINNKLSASVDWYQKTTKDLLLNVPVSSINGFSTTMANAGTVRNRGIEASINWRDQVNRDFTYDIGLNLAHNKNKVTEVNNGSGFINGGENLLSQSTAHMARMQEGFPIGYFWGYKTDGVIQNQTDLKDYLDKYCDGKAANSLQGSLIGPGDLKYVDTDGNGTINNDDKTQIGSPHPDITMGINLNVGYKGFDLSVSTYGAFGMQIAHTYRRFGDGQFDNWTTNVYNYWHGEGTSNRYPMLRPGNTVNLQTISDIYVDDADYFRIQNVMLGYDFKRVWKNSPFQQLRVYVSAQNLFTFTGYSGMNPECGTTLLRDNEPWITGVDLGNYPNARTYMVGVNIKF